MTTVGKLLFDFIWFDLAANELFTCINLLKAMANYQNNAQIIVREVAVLFSASCSSSDSASVWLDIGQFWGNLAKSLTDANHGVDK